MAWWRGSLAAGVSATPPRRRRDPWVFCTQVIPLGITSYRRDWGALCDAATLLGVPRDPLSQAAHEALIKAGMRGKRFRAWVAGGGAATPLGEISDPVAFNAVVRDAPPPDPRRRRRRARRGVHRGRRLG